MPEWVLWVALGGLLVTSWVVLAWVIRRGKLRVRGTGGMITRTDNPVVFWLSIAAMALGAHIAVTILGLLAYFVLLPILRGEP